MNFNTVQIFFVISIILNDKKTIGLVVLSHVRKEYYDRTLMSHNLLNGNNETWVVTKSITYIIYIAENIVSSIFFTNKIYILTWLFFIYIWTISALDRPYSNMKWNNTLINFLFLIYVPSWDNKITSYFDGSIFWIKRAYTGTLN